MSYARFRDFDSEEPAVFVSEDGVVSVATARYTDSQEMSNVKHRNKTHLSPWIWEPNFDKARVFNVKYRTKLCGQIVIYTNNEESYISYWISQEYLAKGITTSAVRMTLRYVFEILNINQVIAMIQPHNLASIRLAEKIGFLENSLGGKHLDISGSSLAHYCYSIDINRFYEINS